MKTSVSWDWAELAIHPKKTTIAKKNLFMMAFIPKVRSAHNETTETVPEVVDQMSEFAIGVLGG